ncbi:hypothetical protein OSG_eHP40_00145 [environmental Halophage eHP-40]|nr:hypothetical protein OSG_eHP40_00145 [environmental Halophage eHP-40]
MSDLRGLVDDLHIQAEHAKISEDIPDQYAEMQEQLANQLAQFIDDEETTELNSNNESNYNRTDGMLILSSLSKATMVCE